MKPVHGIALAAGVALVAGLAWFFLGASGETGRESRGARPLGETPSEPEPRTAAELVEAPTPDPQESSDADEEPAEIFEAEIYGRVLADVTDEPFPDRFVAIQADDFPPAHGRTDELGAFRIRFRGPPEATAVAMPPRGWVPTGPPHLLSPEERRGLAEVVLRFRKGPSAAVRGYVVDKRTSEGVPQLRVELKMDELELFETVVTDDAGAFFTEGAFPAGKLSAEIWDDAPEGPIRIASASREHLKKDGAYDPAWQIEVGIGPTYRLLPAGGGNFERLLWFVELVESPKEGRFSAEIDVGQQGLSLRNTTPRDDRLWKPRMLRHGEPAWVRFPRVEHAPDEDFQPRLVLTGGDRWFGEVGVESTVGRHPEVLGVPLKACGTVGGVIVDEAENGIPSLWVALYPRNADGGEDTALPILQTWTDENGGYGFRHVETTRYLFVVQPWTYPFAVEPVVVQQGPNPLGEYPLPQPRLGPVAGTMTRDLSHRVAGAVLRLRSREGVGWEWVQIAGNRSPYFRFAGVPAGEYDLFISQIALTRRQINAVWGPPKTYLFAPTEGVELTSRDVPERLRVAFDIRDSRGFYPTGRAVYFGPEGALWSYDHVQKDKTFAIPPGEPIRWTVVADGMQPVTGDETRFRGSGDVKVAEVQLELGWGTTVYLRDREGGSGRLSAEESKALRRLGYSSSQVIPQFLASRPLVGARIYADGKPIGGVDRRGVARLRLLSAPETIQVDVEGYRGAALIPLFHRGAGGYQESVLWMERE